MGLLGDAIKRLTSSAGGEPAPATTAAPAPELSTLVTASEIEAVTGGSPQGEARRNGEGSEVDVGRLLIWESKLSNGDEFLITLIAGNDAAAARLAMDRMAEEGKPLEGVGERGLVRVKSYKKTGTSEVGVTALRGSYTLSLTHTSSKGETDPEPLTDLLRKALNRF